jgi:hypothetical protein
MVQTSYSNEKLLKLAEQNYNKLLHYCEVLEDEGYWEQPKQILNKSIIDMLDMYVQAVLINLAVFCGRFHEDEKNFIVSVPTTNVIGCNIAGDVEDNVLITAKRMVSSPPIILQLCGVRDVEKSSDFVVHFFDGLLNILLSMSYLNNAKDTL